MLVETKFVDLPVNDKVEICLRLVKKIETNYDHIYTPIAQHTIIRTFFVTAAHDKMHIRYADVITAFLHWNLEETVHMFLKLLKGLEFGFYFLKSLVLN